jgi:hypothetical protein
MYGSASRGIEGYNEKLSNYGRERTIADNASQSRRQANEANTDSQVARKEEWSRGLNDSDCWWPSRLNSKWDSGVVSTLSGGKIWRATTDFASTWL